MWSFVGAVAAGVTIVVEVTGSAADVFGTVVLVTATDPEPSSVG